MAVLAPVLRAKGASLYGRRPSLVIFTVCFFVYLATGAYFAQSIDVGAAEEPAWALATHGTLNLAGLPHHHLPWYFTHDGGLYSDRFPGAIFYLVPVYWLKSALGLSGFSFLAGVVTSAATAAASCAVICRVFAKTLAPRAATIATLFFAFGTGTWSLTSRMPWSHTLDEFLIVLALYAFSVGRPYLAALLAGLIVPVRPVLAISVAALGASMARLERSAQTLLRYGILAIPGAAVLVAYNGLLFGRWGFSNGHELEGNIHVHYSTILINIAGTLADPFRGVLIYYPLLIVVPVTVRTVWRDASDWEKAAAIAGVLGLLAQLSLNRYSGGDAFFGPRLPIEALTFATPVIARCAVAYHAKRRDRIVPMLLLAGVIIHGMGAIGSAVVAAVLAK